MTAPKQTVWPLEPHTKGKHLVLQGYLKAWLPIISRWNKKILFIDGFSGPGEYENGEPGSPLIAINTFKDHKNLNHSDFEIIFYFIDNDNERVNHLKRLVESIKDKIPGNFKIHTEEGVFNETMMNALNAIDVQNQRLAPCFAMIDPFGVSDTPMSIINRILGNDKSEVYISFMYEWINRFKEHRNFEKHLDNLFGCQEWKKSTDIYGPEAKKNFFFNLYKSQLKKNGAKYVVHFELYEGNRLIYAIFFGTNNIKGCDKMKQAIWKIAPFGDFSFRGTHSSQLTLGLEYTDFTPLIKSLQVEYQGKGWISIEDIIKYVQSDKTDYHSGQVKKQVLTKLEEDGSIEIKSGTRKRAKTYPDGAEIKFL